MPELPEVETVRRSLVKLALHQQITGCQILRGEYVKIGHSLAPKTINAVILDIHRKGKLLAVHTSSHIVILHHLGMSGRLLLVNQDDPLEPHTHIRVPLANGAELRQRDPRRFGYIAILAEDDLPDFPSWKRMGTDALAMQANPFHTLLAGRSKPIKNLLLDQQCIAGMGNIYTDEALFRAKIHPAAPAGSLEKKQTALLLKTMKAVLNESIAAGGSSTNDFQKLDGTLGEFQHKHRVYRRTGEPCVECGSAIVRIVMVGRGTHVCPRCQMEE
jgi:formamidopyrimidine-DNA glycosylase